jgi:hypothetical protein
MFISKCRQYYSRKNWDNWCKYIDNENRNITDKRFQVSQKVRQTKRMRKKQ